MAAWQTASTSTTEDTGGLPARHHHWPDFVVRWLFGRGEEERAAREVSGAVARFQNICISREAGAGAGTIARMVGKRLGWKVYDEELVEAIAHRMEVSARRGPHARRAGAQRRPGLAAAPPRGILRPAGGLSRPPGQADRGHRPRRASRSSSAAGPNYMLPRRDDADGPHHRAVEGARDPAGRADGRLGPDRPAGRPRPRPPPAPFRSHHVPRQLERPPQLRPGARLEQPRPGDRRRDPRPRGRGRPPAGRRDQPPAPARVRRARGTARRSDR